MKKKRKQLENDYRRPLLYIDEVEELCSLFLKCSDSVKITAGDNEYEDFEDFMANNKYDATEFSIEGRLGLSFRMRKVKLGYIAHLTGWNDTPERVAAFHEADSVLTGVSRESWLDKLFWPWCCVMWVFNILLWSETFRGSSFGAALFLGTAIISGVGLCIALWRFFQKQKMVFKRRHEYPPFLERNKDGIVVGLAVGLVLVLVGAGINWAVNEYGSNKQQGKAPSSFASGE